MIQCLVILEVGTIRKKCSVTEANLRAYHLQGREGAGWKFNQTFSPGIVKFLYHIFTNWIETPYTGT